MDIDILSEQDAETVTNILTKYIVDNINNNMVVEETEMIPVKEKKNSIISSRGIIIQN